MVEGEGSGPATKARVAAATTARVDELDRRRRTRNAFALSVGLSGITGLTAGPLLLANVDTRVVGVTAAASAAFGACALLGRSEESPLGAPLLNAILAALLFAGVAVNRQIGPGPAFVGFSLFVAAATLTLPGVILGGLVGAASIAGMAAVAWNEPQLAVRPPAALAYGLSLCLVTTLLSVVQSINTRRSLELVVEREQRALAAEARARESEAQLQQAQKMDALGRMAAAVSHDFNNLLTVIRSAVTLALWEVPETAPSHEALLQAEQATIGAAALTARLLSFSRKAVVDLQVVDAHQALSGLTELLPRALGAGIDLDVRLDANLPPVVAAPVQLEQILLNLALNARDAMPEGGKLSVVARSRRLAEGEDFDCPPGEWLELNVKDTGSGLSDEARAHLFEPFFTTKPEGRGTGLGLSTCYGIVRQMGGTIRAVSAPGLGTTFTVLLPRSTRP